MQTVRSLEAFQHFRRTFLGAHNAEIVQVNCHNSSEEGGVLLELVTHDNDVVLLFQRKLFE
ncbi:hypothetical protein D3C85_1706760 [compost metagenome]